MMTTSTLKDDFAKQYGPWALIAGASEGIGAAFAQQLAAAGINLILLARRPEVLDQTRGDIARQYDVEIRTISADLTAVNLWQQLEPQLADCEIGLLIYNAGATHGADLFHDIPMDAAMNLLKLNCIGPVSLAHPLGQAMRQRGRGGMIFMSSMIALAGGSYVATYSATKAFDLIFAQALWHELAPYGVDVMALIAGATDTPAMAVSGAKFDPDSAMNAQDVAREGLQQLGKQPTCVVGDANKSTEQMLRVAERRDAVELMSAGAAMMFEKAYAPIEKK